MPENEVVWHKKTLARLQSKGTFTDFDGIRTRLLCHTNPNFYGIWTVFIGGGGALQSILRELGSYILRDTAKPWQLKAPGPKPTIKQLKEARKGNGPPCKGNQWPRKGNGPPVTGTKALLIVENAFHCNGSPYGFSCRGSRGAAPKKRPKYTGPPACVI